MVVHASSIGFAETLGNLRGALTARGLAVFSEIDHAAAARDAGLEMAPEVVVLFGNPRAGTPLMESDPRIGIELPLRMLVWEAAGATMVGYNDPRDLGRIYAVDRHGPTLEAMSNLLAELSHKATAQPVAEA